ncbi:MAG: hypothetical protein HKN04_14285 [Rhodothermaceae bacterium]|nr:hypothetical protein [Rhodothermaceae bacterium]
MTTLPVIDYTDKDYASLRRALLEQARLRLPEWTDQSSNDSGALLVDLFAYMGDIVLYYQDRLANEAFLPTAIERRSVMHHLRLIGYELGGAVAAAADLTLTFEAPEPGDPTAVTVPQGAVFSATAADGTPLTFEYLGPDVLIDLEPAGGQVTENADGERIYAGLPVRHSRLVSAEILGSSTGEPNQRFRLAQRPLIPGSLVLRVREGATWITWEQRETLLYHHDAEGRVLLSGPEDRAYVVQVDELGEAWAVSGDGVYGRRFPIGASNLEATYRVGGGIIGNVPVDTITRAETALPGLLRVTNPQAAAGGRDAESMEHAVRFGPLSFRAQRRAVTAGDYVALTHAAGGVAKVRARSQGPHRIDLYVAPEGDTCRPVPDDLRTRLIAYFEDKRMAGTIVYIHDALCIGVDISLEVVAAHHYDPEDVRQRAEAAVRDLLHFARVTFAQPVYLSKIYEAVEALEGVFAATVTRFRRADGPADEVQAVLDEFGAVTVDDLPEVVRRALQVEVVAEGRIELADFEIPALGVLQITIREEVTP